jgi:hypothetical protein
MKLCVQDILVDWLRQQHSTFAGKKRFELELRIADLIRAVERYADDRFADAANDLRYDLEYDIRRDLEIEAELKAEAAAKSRAAKKSKHKNGATP